MKIKALHISAFGGIKNLNLDFEKDFNIVYGDNENGKTSVMSFIKMMFYGTERAATQLSKNLRKKYTPWDNSTMAGSIDFERGGRNYRIERIFGSSNSTDKVTLLNLGLGTRETVSADIGTKLFGLSPAAFERSIFIGQFGFPESNNLAAGELNGKLSNIALTGDEVVSFDKVYERLLNAKYELMSKSGRTGIYDKNIKLQKELTQQLEISLSAEESVKKAKQTAELLNNEIKDLQKKADTLKQQIDSEQDVRNAEKLKELLSLKTELDTVTQSLALADGTVADEMFVRKVEFCLSKLENIKAKITSKQNENEIIKSNLELALNPVSDATPEKAAQLTKRLEDMQRNNDSIAKEIEELENTPPKKPNVLWFILTAVLAALGGSLYLVNPIITFIGLVVAVVFIIIGVASFSTVRTANSKSQAHILDLKLKQNGLISVMASEKANLTAINTALNTTSALIDKQKEHLKCGEADLENLKSELKNETKVLKSLLSHLNDAENQLEITGLLDSIKQKSAKQKELKQNINYILKDVGNISYAKAQEKLSSLNTATNVDFEAVKAEYESVLQAVTDRKTQIAALLTEVKTKLTSHKSSQSIKDELDALGKKIESQKQYSDCLEIALSILTDSYAEVRQSYGSELEKKASKIFSGLTGGRYEAMSISKAFDIAVNKTDTFGSKELDYLSSGTQDQAYLSLRLALAELINEENSLPVILDDSLAQYDDTRTKTALAFLKDYAQGGQIIMFTCHNSVVTLSQDLDANIIRL
ncbi:MAG: AAA family ATPase [Clostridia bacterium]|nr:AAA family ATPase [Clostridia bacterium]